MLQKVTHNSKQYFLFLGIPADLCTGWLAECPLFRTKDSQHIVGQQHFNVFFIFLISRVGRRRKRKSNPLPTRHCTIKSLAFVLFSRMMEERKLIFLLLRIPRRLSVSETVTDKLFSNNGKIQKNQEEEYKKTVRKAQDSLLVYGGILKNETMLSVVRHIRNLSNTVHFFFNLLSQRSYVFLFALFSLNMCLSHTQLGKIYAQSINQ